MARGTRDWLTARPKLAAKEGSGLGWNPEALNWHEYVLA